MVINDVFNDEYTTISFGLDVKSDQSGVYIRDCECDTVFIDMEDLPQLIKWLREVVP